MMWLIPVGSVALIGFGLGAMYHGLVGLLYNNAVMTYNTRIESVPTHIVAGLIGFVQREFFETASPGEREVPEVKFS